MTYFFIAIMAVGIALLLREIVLKVQDGRRLRRMAEKLREVQ